MANSSSSTASLLQSLTSRGWCFSDVDQVRTIIAINCALIGDSSTIDAVEAELCNLDLRSIGGKSLPDAFLLRKASCVLQPPKVLQVASVRDISRSSMIDGGRSSGNRRLLKIALSDGHSEVSAIEYCPIPSISDNVVPGTKVRLEKKVVVHYGIVCLSPDVITVMGGLVQSLYDEWEMNQKYAGFSRSSLRLGREGDTGGPPPFEKLQVGGPKTALTRNASRSTVPTIGKSAKDVEPQQRDQMQASKAKADVASSSKTTSGSQKSEEKPTSSDSRPKEVVDYVPIQNQAAAQKLRQKMNNPIHSERHKGPRFRGKGREEEKPVFTLDEWEKRKTGANPVAREERPGLSHDEELAWRLQNQFDLEDQDQWESYTDEAQDIKKSMFSFDRNDADGYGREGSRGRGRGRGGRGRGRGRGRGGRGRGRGRG